MNWGRVKRKISLSLPFSSKIYRSTCMKLSALSCACAACSLDLYLHYLFPVTKISVWVIQQSWFILFEWNQLISFIHNFLLIFANVYISSMHLWLYSYYQFHMPFLFIHYGIITASSVPNSCLQTWLEGQFLLFDII